MLNCAPAGSAAPDVFLVTDMNQFLTLPAALCRTAPLLPLAGPRA